MPRLSRDHFWRSGTSGVAYRLAFVVSVITSCSITLALPLSLGSPQHASQDIFKKGEHSAFAFETNSVLLAYTHTGQAINQRHLPVQIRWLQGICRKTSFYPRDNNSFGQLPAFTAHPLRDSKRNISLRAPFVHPKIYHLHRLRFNRRQ